MLQYSAYSEDEWSIFDNICISFALAIPVPHHIATAIRQRNNSGNLIYPHNNYPLADYRAFLSRRNPPFLSPPLSMPRRSRSEQNSALKIMELDLRRRFPSDSFQIAGMRAA
jgi:hypothetical protein